MSPLEAVEQQALALELSERIELIDELTISLDTAYLESVERAWAEEAEERLAAYRRCELKAVDAEESKRRLGLL